MLNYQEVLKHFKSLQKRYTTEHNGVMCEKDKVAVEAIEKQIPKKPWYYDMFNLLIKMEGNNAID